jgi:hypothetical protein
MRVFGDAVASAAAAADAAAEAFIAPAAAGSGCAAADAAAQSDAVAAAANTMADAAHLVPVDLVEGLVHLSEDVAVTLSEAGASAPVSQEIPPSRRTWRQKLWRKPFFLLVILPSLLAALYFYAIAAPQYVSEARFTVNARGSDGGAQAAALRGIAGAALGGFGGGIASGDANSVRDFLTSLDAVMLAQERLDLIKLWQRPEADFLARLWDTEPELLARYYNRMVTVSLDPSTNVTTLRVKSFRAEDSKELAEEKIRKAKELEERELKLKKELEEKRIV